MNGEHNKKEGILFRHLLTYALANTNQQSLIFSTSFREIPFFAAYFVFHVSFCLLIIKNRGLPVIVTSIIPSLSDL